MIRFNLTPIPSGWFFPPVAWGQSRAPSGQIVLFTEAQILTGLSSRNEAKPNPESEDLT